MVTSCQHKEMENDQHKADREREVATINLFILLTTTKQQEDNNKQQPKSYKATIKITTKKTQNDNKTTMKPKTIIQRKNRTNATNNRKNRQKKSVYMYIYIKGMTISVGILPE